MSVKEKIKIGVTPTTRPQPYFCSMNEAVMNEAPVKLSEGAIEEVKRLMDAPDFDHSQFLRIGVKGGGCSGMSYLLGFDAREADDREYEVAGIPLLVKPSHALYLAGIVVDYQGGLNNRGFTFKNPNASSTCGCGSSFAV